MKTKAIPDSTSVMVVDINPNSPLAKFNKDTKQQAIEVPRRATVYSGRNYVKNAFFEYVHVVFLTFFA